MSRLLKYALIVALLFNFVSFAGVSLFATGYDESALLDDGCQHEHGDAEHHLEDCGGVHTHAFIFYSKSLKKTEFFHQHYAVKQVPDSIQFQTYTNERPPQA